MSVAWASGIILYVSVFMLGQLGNTSNIDLPAEMVIVTAPLVMMTARLMYYFGFFIDKTPSMDILWDSLHTVTRISHLIQF